MVEGHEDIQAAGDDEVHIREPPAAVEVALVVPMAVSEWEHIVEVVVVAIAGRPAVLLADTDIPLVDMELEKALQGPREPQEPQLEVLREGERIQEEVRIVL